MLLTLKAIQFPNHQGKSFNQIATDTLAEGNNYNKKYAGENIAHVVTDHAKLIH
ncbi:hypothetical protein QE197_23875 (plasmid) [Arsenophonus nasoniae]|uniref:hypothetical protein n=1 Tax=Arsenophonus nasoniae TaxID=638 RepID=UPI0024688068|nr:hypothetical protein [Arsenophonus nasoniae]WGM13551.1 hypothetical protein QE197_23875 [Arsenophonus nasoniae]WGM18151.1 hypothetical protein QE193_23350 [Arsenophonus nasoniae]